MIQQGFQNFIGNLIKLGQPNVSPLVIVEFLKEEGALTITKAYTSGNKIYQLVKADNQLVFDSLNGLLQATCQSLNVSKSLNTYQAMEIIYKIMNDYKILTLESVVIAFKNGKSGKCGATYNRVDIEIVTGWLDSFCASDEYINEIEKSNRIAPIDNTTEPLTPLAQDWFKKIKETALNGGKEVIDKRKDNTLSAIRKQRLLILVLNKSASELKQMRKEFEAEPYKVGIEIIDKELAKRK